MYTVNGITYDLKFTMKAVDNIEKAVGKSILQLFANRAFTISELRACFQYGLTFEDGSKVATGQAVKVFDAIIEGTDYGYSKLLNDVATHLMEDTPFLFQTA